MSQSKGLANFLNKPENEINVKIGGLRNVKQQHNHAINIPCSLSSVSCFCVWVKTIVTARSVLQFLFIIVPLRHCIMLSLKFLHNINTCLDERGGWGYHTKLKFEFFVFLGFGVILCSLSFSFILLLCRMFSNHV